MKTLSPSVELIEKMFALAIEFLLIIERICVYDDY
jgi:hypothetical protein